MTRDLFLIFKTIIFFFVMFISDNWRISFYIEKTKGLKFQDKKNAYILRLVFC